MWILLALLAAAAPAQDDRAAVRALRPADTKPFETALLDGIEAEARQALASIRHARTRAEAQAQRATLRRKLEDSLGHLRLPWPKDLRARITGSLDRPGYRIEKVVWESLPGVVVPAHLYLPVKREGRTPAILFYSGHWWPDSKTRPDFQAFCINMARMGFVVLAWDPFGQGERGVSSRDHRRVETLLAGVSQQGIAVHETRVALEYLLTRPEVDPKRIGMTGASGGGYNTWMMSALDERIAAAVPVVGTSEFFEQIQVTRPLDWYRASEHCHFVPGLIRYADNHELLAMIAPRPLLIVSASVDQSFPVAGVRRIHEYGRALYDAFGASGKHAYSEDASTGHGYQQKKREAAYGWFARWLQGRGDGAPIAEPPTEPPAFDDPELRVLPPGQNAAAGPGIVAVARKLRGPARPPSRLQAERPAAVLKPDRVQRLLLPAPAYFIRGSGARLLLAIDDRGKEAALDHPAIAAALQQGASLLALDPRGMGEQATTQTGWLSAVHLLLGEYFPERQARDLLSAAALFPGQRLEVFANGPNAALIAELAKPSLPATYHVEGAIGDFIERPGELDASYKLLPNNDNRFAYDREVPFFFVRWKGSAR